MSDGLPLTRTTFYRHRCAIEDIFGIYIDCDRRAGYKYYIGNEHVLNDDTIQNWMLSTMSVGNLINESQSLSHRILLENIPSAGESLQSAIQAMKENRMITLTYRRYGSSNNGNYTLAPYFIKLFHQRWYLFARFESGMMVTFSFDRIVKIEILSSKFIIDKDFNAKDSMDEYYGIIFDHNVKTERIVLRAYGYEQNYLRDLPLHHSQREIYSSADYADFELRLKPTADFKAALMSRGKWIEILEPQSLIDEIIEWHKNAIDRYKK